MSRTYNTVPYRVRETEEQRRKCWKTRAMNREKQIRAGAWWAAIRAAEHAALRVGDEPPPARHRHTATWDCW